jgi:hypothetical protein
MLLKGYNLPGTLNSNTLELPAFGAWFGTR